MKDTKIYIGLEHWIEDYDNHGTNVSFVSFKKEGLENCDEVEVWVDGQKKQAIWFDHSLSKWVTY